jgi:hypothetical protein
MAGRGSETGSGNEAHRAPGESGNAEGAGLEHPQIDQARGASGDDLDRMERKLEREGKLPDAEQPGGRNPGGRGESTTRDQGGSAGKGETGSGHR